MDIQNDIRDVNDEGYFYTEHVINFSRVGKSEFIDVYEYDEEKLLQLANKMAVHFKEEILNKTKPNKNPEKEEQRQAQMDKYVCQKALKLLNKFVNMSIKKHEGRRYE